MATEITGSNAQVGTLNKQFIETITNSNNNNNNVTININVVHCTASHQHQHQEGVSISGGDVPQLMDTLKSIVESCGQTSQIHVTSQSTIKTPSEAAVKSDSVPAIQTRTRQVRKRRGKDVPQHQTEVNADSVRIVDSHGQVLEPGNAVWINRSVYSLYVGDGYVVRYNEYSQIVVNKKLDMTQPFRKATPHMRDNVNVFRPEQRVQRALQHVGKPCPVQYMNRADFVYWTYTGLDSEQCLGKGFILPYFH